MEILDRYFQAIRDHDWETLRSCVSQDVHRTGPFGDVVEGREAYAKFLADVVPKLENYELRVRDEMPVAGGGTWVRLSEILDLDGVSTEFPEALYFEFDEARLIERVDVYLKRC